MTRMFRVFIVSYAAGMVLAIVAGVAFAVGLGKAERQYTQEMNAMRHLQQQLYAARARDGEFPRPSTDHYERPGLTVSDVSDTSVSFYSGVMQTHLLTLHVRGDGVLLTSRR